MPRYPSATWRPLVRNYTAINSTKNAVILHTSASGTATSLHGWFSNKDAQASSHFHVDNQGRVEQYLDTNHISWANGEGNSRSVTIETQGTGTEPWTDAQVTALVGLLRWCHTTHGIPLRPMSSSRSTERGIGWHRLGIDGNFPALPSILAGRIQRGGGEVWSKARGKTCPGDARIRQIPGILAQATTPLTTASTPTPQEDTLSAEEVKQINAHTTAETDRLIKALESIPANVWRHTIPSVETGEPTRADTHLRYTRSLAGRGRTDELVTRKMIESVAAQTGVDPEIIKQAARDGAAEAISEGVQVEGTLNVTKKEA